MPFATPDSGDTVILNSGVLVLRSSPWMKEFLRGVMDIALKDPEWDKAHHIGVGGDNAALAIAIAGCTHASSFPEKKACWLRADWFVGSPHIRGKMVVGDRSVYSDSGVPAEIQPHLSLIPQSQLQTYFLLEAFVVHYPGFSHRDDPAFANDWVVSPAVRTDDRGRKLMWAVDALFGDALQRNAS